MSCAKGSLDSATGAKRLMEDLDLHHEFPHVSGALVSLTMFGDVEGHLVLHGNGMTTRKDYVEAVELRGRQLRG